MSTMERTQQQIDKISQSTSPQETQSMITALPVQVVYEARYALQQVKEQFAQAQQTDPSQLIEVVEPLARVIGWTEALVFAVDSNKQAEFVKTLHGVGTSK